MNVPYIITKTSEMFNFVLKFIEISQLDNIHTLTHQVHTFIKMYRQTKLNVGITEDIISFTCPLYNNNVAVMATSRQTEVYFYS